MTRQEKLERIQSNLATARRDAEDIELSSVSSVLIDLVDCVEELTNIMVDDKAE